MNHCGHSVHLLHPSCSRSLTSVVASQRVHICSGLERPKRRMAKRCVRVCTVKKVYYLNYIYVQLVITFTSYLPIFLVCQYIKLSLCFWNFVWLQV